MTRFSDTQGGAIMGRTRRSAAPRVYFDVDDINAATARVSELGGEAGEALPVPGMGWFSVCKDTEGNEFGLWQNDPNAAPPTRRRRRARADGRAPLPARRPGLRPVRRIAVR